MEIKQKKLQAKSELRRLWESPEGFEERSGNASSQMYYMSWGSGDEFPSQGQEKGAEHT